MVKNMCSNQPIGENVLGEKRWEGFKALACSIEISARLDPDPLVGQLYPKSHSYLMKMTSRGNGPA